MQVLSFLIAAARLLRCYARYLKFRREELNAETDFDDDTPIGQHPVPTVDILLLLSRRELK